jgi:hypothetical protein
MNFRFTATCVLLVALCVVVASAEQRLPSARLAAAAAVIPQKPAPPGPLPPLPVVSFTPPIPMPDVQRVFEFAARHPEVLQYVPCYCGCERMGHLGNHECFVKSRAANGRVTEWESHGMGCAVCLQVGYIAMTLFNQGHSVTDIRATIDKEVGIRYSSSTPTPKPPPTPKKAS